MIPIDDAGIDDATTESVLYTCPPNHAAVATVYVAEHGGTGCDVSIALSKGGGAATDADYLVRNKVLAVDDDFKIGPLVLDAADEIRVESSAAHATFNVVGEELAD